jgi:2-polyprenyl-6-methoxyphenol hydroxylase-like FAD-dependent oxidoreductase
MGISTFPSAETNGVHHGKSEYVNGISTTEARPVDVPVLIVGGGPTGLLQAHLLSRLGGEPKVFIQPQSGIPVLTFLVKSLLVERYPERLGAPKAHALSPRSLEICRQFGLDVVRIRQLGTKREDAFWVNFLTSLSGKAVGQLPYERMDLGVLEETPEVSLFFSLMAESNVQQMIHNIPQPRFEQFLSEYLARDDNVDLRKGVSFVSLVQVSFMILTVPRRD